MTEDTTPCEVRVHSSEDSFEAAGQTVQSSAGAHGRLLCLPRFDPYGFADGIT